MHRLILPLSICLLFLGSQAFAKGSEIGDNSAAFKSRKVMGVIYFEKNHVELSKDQQTEIDRIVNLGASQCTTDKFVRVEGFSSGQESPGEFLNYSFARAESVWSYLGKNDLFNKGNLYLTGFNAQQKISTLHGDRVEIALYENFLCDNMNIYSSK